MNHLKEIASRLNEFGLDAMLVSSPAGEFYSVGFHGEGAVIVTKDRHFYITDSRYMEAAEKAVSGAEITVTSRSRDIVKAVSEIVAACGIGNLGYEGHAMTVAAHERYAGALACGLRPAQKLLSGLRAAKGQDEIAAMEHAQRIAEQAFREILTVIRPGMTEKEIAARLVYEMLCHGAEKLSFDPIVVSGPNGSQPHGVPGARAVGRGDFITMDFGCISEGYCSDMTRTVAMGHVSDEMRAVYGLVLEAQRAGIRAAKANIPGKAIDAAARKVIEDAGYGEFFGHGFGHSLGLEVHEPPNANTAEETLMPVGAVISAEPGIYLPGRFGVRIEDVLVLHETGCLNLTRAPKELIIL